MNSIATQLSLDGFGRAEANDRLFLALFPPAETASQIEILRQQICQQLGLQGSAVRADRLHLTLHHLGDHSELPASLVANVARAMNTLQFSTFDLMLNCATRFSVNQRKPMLVLTSDNADELRQLREHVSRALASAGLNKYIDRTFTPHVTLLYGAAAFSTQAIAPIKWTVKAVTLVHSMLRQTRHIPLGNWPLH